MKPHEIAALNLHAIELAEERLRDISTDWDLRMALIHREKVERDTLSNFIEDTRAAVKKGRDEGRDEGLKEGRDEGLKDGLQLGERQGLVKGQRKALLHLLDLRGVATTPEQRARINACEDLDQLNAWFAQALHCQTAADLR